MRKLLAFCLTLVMILSLSACGVSTAIVSIALFIIGILAIPVCVFLIPIMIVWELTDRIVQVLERK